MSTRLNGDLSFFPLIDILKFLTALGLSGSISVETGKSAGVAYIENGKIVHASYKNLFQGETAFLRLFTISDGTFVFKNERIPLPTIERSTEELLDEVCNKLSFWEDMRKIVPSEDICFKIMPLSSDFDQNKIIMSREQLLILTRLDGTRNVIDIASELKMETIEVSEVLTQLFNQGFIEALDVFETREIEQPDKSSESSVFSGNLKFFSLLNLIDLINYRSLSGKLKLLRGIYQGEIFFEEGEIIHANNRIWEGEMALVDLLSWLKGRFYFIPGLSKTEKTVTTSVDDIITTSGDVLSKWRKIQGVILTPESVFSPGITEQEDEDEVLSFTRREWKILYNIDGHNSIRNIAEKLNYSKAIVAESIYSLYKEGHVKPSGISNLSLILDELNEKASSGEDTILINEEDIKISEEADSEEKIDMIKTEEEISGKDLETPAEVTVDYGENIKTEEIFEDKMQNKIKEEFDDPVMQSHYTKVKQEVDDLISIMDLNIQSDLDDSDATGFLDR